jgi:hypothetical protein
MSNFLVISSISRLLLIRGYVDKVQLPCLGTLASTCLDGKDLKRKREGTCELHDIRAAGSTEQVSMRFICEEKTAKYQCNRY